MEKLCTKLLGYWTDLHQPSLEGIPAASFTKLAELCCFELELDGVFGEGQMVKHDLAAEQVIIKLLR